jgi:CBS domain-containing protein
MHLKENDMSDEKVRTEVFRVNADETVAKVKEIIAEGNVRRIIIQSDEGKNLIEFPMTVGVAAAAGVLLLAPMLAAVGALAAIVTDINIVVEREE